LLSFQKRKKKEKEKEKENHKTQSTDQSNISFLHPQQRIKWTVFICCKNGSFD